MTRWARPSVGLLGRIFAILLLTVLFEFAASTLLYERANRFSVREDEARRLAEHLVIARKLVNQRPWEARPAMAGQLTTDRYIVRWQAARPSLPALAPGLSEMRRQVIAWEPSLARTDLHMRLASPGRHGVVTGALRLADGSWLAFSTVEHIIDEWPLVFGRMLIAVVPAMALIILGGLLVRRTLRPMERLAHAAERIGLGGSEILPLEGPAEMRRVTTAFNEMQHRIHRLIAERTEALAAVGHDLRTPLARLRLRIEGVGERDVRAAIGSDLAEMEAMLASLLTYMRGEDDPEQPVRADIAVIAATIVDDAADRGMNAVYDGVDHLEAQVRIGGLKRAIGNLVENGIHYGKRVRVDVARASDGGVTIRIDDDGPGIPEDALDDVREPFHRLDSARARNTQGLGLGLAIVARAVERERGVLDLINRAGGGLRAEIRLPAV